MEWDDNPSDTERSTEVDRPPEVTDADQVIPTAATENFAEAYARQMHEGEQQYIHVLHLLEDMGLPAHFTQTGGMNAAIEVTLASNHYLLVTDAESSLAWRWIDHRGWMVGRYRLPETEEDDTTDPLGYRTTDDGSSDALVVLIQEVLSDATDQPKD
jgi:hypothetical protein